MSAENIPTPELNLKKFFNKNFALNQKESHKRE